MRFNVMESLVAIACWFFATKRRDWKHGSCFKTVKVVGTVGFAGLVLAAIWSCSQANVGVEQKWLSFRCPDGQTVMAQFHLPEDQFVNVRFAGRELRLPHTISGSGARYSDGKTTFWNKGRSVLVEVDEKIVVQDCMLEEKPQG
jgi:membrane-bound inhibitor of C-type lysozyme